MLKKPNIYVDTSVIGGCFDDEFSYWSHKLIDNFYNDDIAIFISTITEVELIDAPEIVKELYYNLVDSEVIVLEETEESLVLAEKYIVEEILSPNYRDDARHISVATFMI